ncbi:hypothetical protein [Micromonospora sp. KC606]|uniref:hypothetical protein n=1 Tax=Micromonospora sp. KC606 TaxID=2530379 RepID=UPI001A9E086D|nr:hypothetical protein [Micromonospora sp. KC606]
MQASFMPGLQLCRAFYVEAVRPLLDEAYPGLRYAAARLGPGSEVLGFDTERSVDHDWGPRLVEAFVGRAAEAGDEVGSRVVAARLVREVMRLCLLWPADSRRTASGWAPRSPRCRVRRVSARPALRRVTQAPAISA